MKLNAFEIPIWLDEIDESLIDEALNDIPKIYDELTLKNNWRDPVLSTFGVSPEGNILTQFHSFKKIILEVEKKVHQYIRSCDGDTDTLINFEYWLNVYEKGHSQEIHTHGLCPVSGTLHLTDTPDQYTMFVNAIPTRFRFNKMPDVYNLGRQYETKKGRLILFPGELYHGTTVNNNNKRITLAFNFDYESNVNANRQ